MFSKIVNLLNNKLFNKILYMGIICPFLYLIQYDWEKYCLFALLLAVFILIKNMLLFVYDYFIQKENKISFLTIILKLIGGILLIPLFLLQYKYKVFIKFNVWIAGIIYFKYIIDFIDKKYNIKIINKIKS
jgi:hypothetical protein